MLITKAINFLLEREQLCIYYLPLAGKILNFPAPDIFQKNILFFRKVQPYFLNCSKLRHLMGK